MSPSPGADLKWRDNLFWGAGLAALDVVSAAAIAFCGLAQEVSYWVGPELLGLIAQLVALHALWCMGTFRIAQLHRIAAFSFGIVLFGAWFKIQHWPTADALLLSGMIGIIVPYLLHYLRKRSKCLSDHLKIAWVLLAPTVALLRIYHLWSHANELASLAFGLFWCIVGIVLWETRHLARATGNTVA